MQKIVTPEWRAAIEQIYSGYLIYHQSSGAEPTLVWNAGESAKPKSRHILDSLSGLLRLDTARCVLDIGCGNGGLLRSISLSTSDHASLFGLEVNDRFQKDLKDIPKFERLFIGDTQSVDRRFDLITLIHSLEHMEYPVCTLKNIRNLLNQDGVILVQVPDSSYNIFDISVFDHRVHFDPTCFRTAVSHSGLFLEHLSSSVVPGEISAVLSRDETALPEGVEAPTGVAMWLDAAVDDLERLRKGAVSAVSQAGSIGVFGSANGAAWLAASLPVTVDFFLDEDPGRVGGSMLGRPILHPDRTPEGATVLMPFPPEKARRIAARFEHLQCRFVI